jgi:hypothetical protein
MQDSLELTNGFRVGINVRKDRVDIDWYPKPPYDKDMMDAIKEHIDPWIIRTIANNT